MTHTLSTSLQNIHVVHVLSMTPPPPLPPLAVHTLVGFGIRSQTTYKIGIQISAATRSFLPILGPCVGQRNTTLHTKPDLDTPSTSDSNPANVKSPK